MTEPKPAPAKSAPKSRQSLQAAVLVALLAAPIPAYLAAQAGLNVIAGVLVSVAALIMIATIWLT